MVNKVPDGFESDERLDVSLRPEGVSKIIQYHTSFSLKYLGQLNYCEPHGSEFYTMSYLFRSDG